MLSPQKSAHKSLHEILKRDAIRDTLKDGYLKPVMLIEEYARGRLLSELKEVDLSRPVTQEEL